MAQKTPNIVLICTDQMRRDCVGAFGNPEIETPALDTMKRQGCAFTRAYSAVPSCIPARAALLTGLSQEHHGRVGYRDGVRWNYAHTLPGEFAKAGYHTQCIGKMHVSPARNLLGFQNVLLNDGYMHHGRAYTENVFDNFCGCNDYLYWLKREKGVDVDIIDDGMEVNSWVCRPWLYEEKYHSTNWTVSESIDFLRRRDPDKPFFLMTSFVAPHPPYTPPRYYYDMYINRPLSDPLMGDWAKQDDADQNGLIYNTDRGIIPPQALKRAKAAYYGSITHIDHQILRLIQAVFEYRQLSNTVFVFLSDHGEMLGDHHLFRKFLPYEGSSGVPLLFYDPGDVLGIRKNRSIPALAELRDVMPTLLDIAGLPIPKELDGKSLLPLMRGETGRVRDFLHGEHTGAEGPDGLGNQFIVTEHDKYIWFSRTGRELYFDLDRDPHELHDAIQDPGCQARINLLRSQLVQLLAGREEGYSDGQRLIPGQKQTPCLKHLFRESTR